MQPLAQPPNGQDSRLTQWLFLLWKRVNSSAGIDWSIIDKTGSNLTDIETRNHVDLQNHNTTDYYHLTQANHTDLTDGGVTQLHKHDTEYVTYPTSLTIGTPTHVTSLQRLLDHSWSAGIIDGCAITDNGDGTVSTGAGNATLRASNDPHSSLYDVEVTAQTNISLTDDATNYLILDYNAGSPTFIVSTSITGFDGMDTVIGYVIHRSGTVLHIIDSRNINVDNARKAAHMFLDYARFIHAENGTILGSPTGVDLSVTSGHFYFMLNELYHDAFDTSVAGTANVNTFTLWYRDGIGGWTEVIEQKTVDTSTYDGNTGTPVTLGNNKYGVTWCYIVHDSPSEFHCVMGQEEYANMASAEAAAAPTSVPTIISGIASLIGAVVYEKGVTTFDDIRSAFTQQFTSSAATVHNGLSGIQGGQVNEYYHMTANEYANVQSDLWAFAAAQG